MGSGKITFELIASVVAALVTVGCAEEKKPEPAPTKPAQTAPAVAPSPPRMPEVTLTQKYVRVGMDELQVTPSLKASLSAMLKKYPVSEADKVLVNVERRVSSAVATEVLYELFDAGAKDMEVRTPPRGAFAGQLTVRSQAAFKQLPPCTPVGVILGNLATAYWPIKGGTAKRYTKGMAGPDLSAMHSSFEKYSDTCPATVFLFSSEPEVEWGHAFDLAASVKAHEPPYKIDSFVLLRTAPVAGKALQL